MTDAVRDLVVRAKREKPRRSIRRIIKMLERAHVVAPGELSRSSVHRLLAREGGNLGASIPAPRRGRRAVRDAGGAAELHRRARRGSVGRRALHVHRRVGFPDGFVGKAYLLSQIDSASRYLPHSYFSRHEQDVDQEHGLAQAILKYGPPCSYYVDRGPAYMAGSLAAICAELSILLRHAGKRDAEAKGVIERWHRTWREEVEDELPRDGVIGIEDLTAIHFAWLAREYHDRVHDTTGAPPRDRFLAEVSLLRAAPPPDVLAKIFLHREPRTVRKDATVRWRGGFWEVRPELAEKKVELRFVELCAAQHNSTRRSTSRTAS